MRISYQCNNLDATCHTILPATAATATGAKIDKYSAELTGRTSVVIYGVLAARWERCVPDGTVVEVGDRFAQLLQEET